MLISPVSVRIQPVSPICPPDSQDAQAFGQRFGALLAGLAHPKCEAAAAPRLLFHHMPKAGGTTCRNVFATWFKLRDDDRAPWSTKPAPPPFNLAGVGCGTLTAFTGLSALVALVRSRFGPRLLTAVDAVAGAGLLGFAGLLGWRTAHDA